jgi:membrane fusion protein (multidrug efflux system)
MALFSRLIGMTVFVFYISCGQLKNELSDTENTFQVIQPRLVDTIFLKKYVADIQSLRNVEMRTRVKGFIEKIHVDEGKPVQEGQILFTLGGRELRENLLRENATLKALEAEYKVAEVEWKNTRMLAEKKIISKSELEMAIARKEAVEARIEEAKASVEIAKLNLSLAEIRAPFDGVINRIPLKTGSVISEGDLLTTISNNREVFAYFNVSEKEFIDVMRQDSLGEMKTVSLLMANNELFPYNGRVETVENEIDRATGNIAFRARFRNPDLLLKHGASGTVLVEEELKDALIIPQKSSFEIQDKIYVYVVDSTNTIRVRNIVPSRRLTHFYVVQTGLSTEDRVLYEGIQQVKEGLRIQPEVIPFRDLRFE